MTLTDLLKSGQNKETEVVVFAGRPLPNHTWHEQKSSRSSGTEQELGCEDERKAEVDGPGKEGAEEGWE